MTRFFKGLVKVFFWFISMLIYVAMCAVVVFVVWNYVVADFGPKQISELQALIIAAALTLAGIRLVDLSKAPSI